MYAKNHGTPENIHGDWDHSTHENGTTQVRDCTQEKVVESELKCSVNSENSTAKDITTGIRGVEMYCQTDITCDTMEIHEKKKVIGPKTFQQKCIETLLNVTLITKLVTMLSNAGCLENFVQLITHISEGTMSCMNIAFLLCLDLVKLHSCITTTAMHFRKETKQIWELVCKMCKGRVYIYFQDPKTEGAYKVNQ